MIIVICKKTSSSNYSEIICAQLKGCKYSNQIFTIFKEINRLDITDAIIAGPE